MPALTTTPTAAPPTGEGADPSVADEEALADQAAEDIFGSEENARNTAGLITNFVESWERHKHEKTPADWLADEFRRHPHLWSGEEEIVSTANEIFANIEQANADKASLHAHLDAGKSKASWLARTDRGRGGCGVASVGECAATIDNVCKAARKRHGR